MWMKDGHTMGIGAWQLKETNTHCWEVYIFGRWPEVPFVYNGPKHWWQFCHKGVAPSLHFYHMTEKNRRDLLAVFIFWTTHKTHLNKTICQGPFRRDVPDQGGGVSQKRTE